VTSSYNKGRYTAEGSLQGRFSAFAKKQGVLQIVTDKALRKVKGEDAGLKEYFIDAVHVNAPGNEIVANELSKLVHEVLAEKDSSPKTLMKSTTPSF